MLIPTSILRAVSLAMGKNDIRYYFNGMLIEAAGSTARLVATDGSRLHIADVDLPEPIPAPMLVIVPRALIDWALKQAGRKVAVVDIVVIPSPPDAEGKPTAPHLTVTVAGATMTERAIAGRFPTYAQVIPHELSGEPGQYDPRYVLDAYNACSEYLQMGRGKEHVTALRMNGTGAAVMAVGKFAAIVMPWRAVETDIAPCLLRPVGTPDPASAVPLPSEPLPSEPLPSEPLPSEPLPSGWESDQAANACSEVAA